jgi:hypothetical protein
VTVDLQTAAIGTPHFSATCCWCSGPLVVNQVENLRCWTCATEVCIQRCVKYAIRPTYSKGTSIALGLGNKGGTYCWHVPLPSQVQIYEQSYKGGYYLWAGQAGPGKSVGVRRFLYWRCLVTPGHHALLLRENWDMLRDNHTLRMADEVPRLGGRWREGDKLAVFGTGSDESVIHCGHMAEASAVTRIVGMEYGTIVPEEASLYPLDPLTGLSVLAELTRACRAVGAMRDGTPVLPFFVPLTNPGGPSASWLKDMFIDHAPDFEQSPQLASMYNPEQWVFQPAARHGNPYLPVTYEATLALNSSVKYRQLAEGDWSAFAGAFFPEYAPHTHLVDASIA